MQCWLQLLTSSRRKVLWYKAQKWYCIKVSFDWFLDLQLACNKPSVALTSTNAAFWILLWMFRIRRSDFFWKLLSCFQISLFISGALNLMQFSGVWRFWDSSLTFFDVNFVCHFPSTLCAKRSESFGPYTSSLLSSSMDFRISPVLLTFAWGDPH